MTRNQKLIIACLTLWIPAFSLTVAGIGLQERSLWTLGVYPMLTLAAVCISALLVEIFRMARA